MIDICELKHQVLQGGEQNDGDIGIYIILNRVDSSAYIGQSKDLKTRFRNHKSSLRSGSHHNSRLQNAWNAYGESNFIFSVICECDSLSLDDTESAYISAAWDHGCYNGTINPLGGARDGAGRKQVGDTKTKHYTITLDDKTAEAVKEYGGGNMSDGIRRLMDLIANEREASRCPTCGQVVKENKHVAED